MKIQYLTRHGIAEWTEFDNSGQDVLSLCFEPDHNGALVIESRVFPLKDGEAVIPTKCLSDGEYTPKLESELGVFNVEGFIKSGRSISPRGANEDVIRSLISRCYSLEKALALLTERVAKLEDACGGHNIFNFERKEK